MINTRGPIVLSAIACCLLTCRFSTAAETKEPPSETTLYKESIRSTKQTIARETLDVFYRDALDYYRERRYNEALELLDKIYSVDPSYEDVEALRRNILKTQTTRLQRNVQDQVYDWMRKGNNAYESGQPALAISYWRQALVVNPGYVQAQKRIDEANHQLAQKQFETGYLHYHRGEMEDALDSWQNAIALDPTYKQRGLLLLMSKVELKVRKDQVARLVSQAYEQYSQRDYDASLKSYEELLQLEPRHEEARRMSAKIKITLGQAAYKAARESRARKLYTEALKHYHASIRYNYEVPSSQKGIQEIEALVKKSREPVRVKPTVAKSTAAVQASTTPAVAASPAPASPADAEAALVHYRQGLGAIKSRNIHHALSELKIANQLDPSNEHIYIAYQRAQQELNAIQQVPEGAPSAGGQP